MRGEGAWGRGWGEGSVSEAEKEFLNHKGGDRGEG